ncbi:MAG: 50S ribosomal protein L11 methyltransferase [Cyclobacteriaceae bacterium]|nr:50S ribosomal protein L11 methyltransferase [Cyclobacteriaceae bacterium]
MKYLKITFKCEEAVSELLIAMLSELDYDSFEETECELLAYVKEDLFSQSSLDKILNSDGFDKILYQVENLEEKNWNEEWERNFQPVIIDETVKIRASFHAADPKYQYDIVIDPKMSFGTGHHETTSLMISSQLAIDHKNKRILDLGTGTGILSIMASKLGSACIVATDIDEWCIENSLENFKLNSVSQFELKKGTISSFKLDGYFNIILANINKNVLIEEIPFYTNYLSANAFLLLSGFYERDIEDIRSVAEKAGLQFLKKSVKNHWSCLLFSK